MRLVALLSLTIIGLAIADNPLNSYRALADPNALVVNDRVYIYCSNDDDNSSSSYDIKSYVLLSSADMVNWTDHGEVFRVPRDASWAGLAYAPAAAWRNNKMYLYFPNGGYTIGVATADRPEGPFTDPLKRALINNTLCDGVAWCFDPGVFVDDDGQAYLYYGGGENANYGYGFNFRVVKLNSDMISVSGSPARITGTTNSFEAPFVHKYNGKYYLSFSSAALHIDYAISSNPMSGFTFAGRLLSNPTLNGTNINNYNNNHQSVVKFKDKWYVAYHDRRVFNTVYKRNVSLDIMEYNADGTIKPVVVTASGPPQVGRFNPYDSIPAATMSAQQGVRGITNSNRVNILIPVKASGTSWIRLSGVDFGSSGASAFRVHAASLNANNKVEIRTGSPTGTLAGTCNLTSTGSWTSYATNQCSVSGLTGVQNYVYLKFTGSDSSAALQWFRFVASAGSSSSGQSSSVPVSSSSRLSSSSAPLSSSSSVARAAYSSATIPGTIQAENYDLGGEGVAYHDEDSANQGAVYRQDGVDITGNTTDGYKIGWTIAGEWLEYTVRVNTAGIYTWSARVSSGLDGSSFRIYLGSQDITGNISVPNTGGWDTYTTVSGTTPRLNAGQQTLRIAITGSYCNIDWIQFSEGAVSVLPAQKTTLSPWKHKLYNLLGRYLGQQ